MKRQTITRFDSNNPSSHFDQHDSFALYMNGLRQQESSCCYVNIDDKGGYPELLVWLPGVAGDVLAELAGTSPRVRNVTSANHLYNNTYICWEVDSLEVRVDAWQVNADIPQGGEKAGYGVTFFNENDAWHAPNPMSDEEVEFFLEDLQVATICSGPNYKPHREWDAAFLEECKHLQDEDDKVVVPVCMHRNRSA